MKVYAVIEKIVDEDGTEYDVVVDDYIYSEKKDAKKRMEELVKEHRWSDFKIRDFEVKE